LKKFRVWVTFDLMYGYEEDFFDVEAENPDHAIDKVYEANLGQIKVDVQSVEALY